MKLRGRDRIKMDIELKNPMEEACSEFGLYLNISGTAEAASGALLNLFLLLDKPENPIEFVRENLDPKLNVDLEKLKAKVVQAQEELAELDEIVAELKAQSIRLIEEQAAREGDEYDENIVEWDEIDTESKKVIDDNSEADAEVVIDANQNADNGEVQESQENETTEKETTGKEAEATEQQET